MTAPASRRARVTPAGAVTLNIRHGVFSVKGDRRYVGELRRMGMRRRAAAGSARRPGRLWIFLPNEGFKGILAMPLGARRQGCPPKRWDREASVQGAKFHRYCQGRPGRPIEPKRLLPRQTVRADR